MIDRKTAPQTELPTKLELIATEQTTTPSGVVIHSLYAPSADVVRVSLIFDVGSRHQNLPFLANTTVAMLAEGCQAKTSEQIAEHFDFYGIYYDASVDRDSTIITIAAASEFLVPALEMVRDMIAHPTFDEHDLELHKAKRREQMIIDNQKPATIARRNFVGALFGDDHPYGRTWDPDMIDPLTSDDLRAFHRQWFVASNMYVVSSGNVMGETIAQITNAVELLPRGEKTVDQSIMLPTSEGLHRDIWREGVTQSSIRMGCLMPGKSSIDFIPLQLLTTVLGGYFSSRLMQNLREERGYTYGVYAGLATLRYASYMAIQCEVASEVQADAIEQIKYEIRRLTTEKISSEELAMAKNTIIGELMRLVDGPFGIADITIENLQSGVADDYINTFLARISSTTSDELLALAARYFDPERLTQVVVGSHKE